MGRLWGYTLRPLLRPPPQRPLLRDPPGIGTLPETPPPLDMPRAVPYEGRCQGMASLLLVVCTPIRHA